MTMLAHGLPGKPNPQVKDWIVHHASASPGALAIVDLSSGRKFTYGQMNQRVGRAAAVLADMGVKANDRVAYLALNSSDIFEIVFGTWRIGGSALALNYRLTASELEFIIKDASPTVIIYDREFEGPVSNLRKTVDVKWLVTDGQGGASEYERALTNSDPIFERTTEQDLSAQAMLMYSSGTTGQPKGVIISHENLLYSALDFSTACNLGKDAVHLAIMPIFHIAGFNVLSCANLRMGGTVLIERTFNPASTLEIIGNRNFGVTHFLGIPAIYNALRAHPNFEKTDFSGLKHALAGAAAVPHALIKDWLEHGVIIQEGFGMTETAGGTCILPKHDVPNKIGSAGKAFMNSEMKIVRSDGSDAAPDETGEIFLRGPIITPGYWNRPKANAESFVDGWFKSGDVGQMDAQGFIYIEDRVKDMYISGGENVYPAEVENILFQMPQIADVAVIGIPDKKWGEIGCAVVVPKAGTSLSLGDISLHCTNKLAKFKHPSHLIVLDELPRNATGKVLKFELREMAANMPPQADSQTLKRAW